MWNENELIVDDEKITLPTTENDPKIKQVAFSPDGKSLLIAVNYKTYGNEQQHKGVYLFFYQDGALVKELPLPTLSGKEIWNLAVDTADENGVSNYACSDNTGNLYFNGHPFEQKRKDIETFTFQDGKLHIR
ncbi:MAG: hypothetical protein LBG52_03735 [Candidatus Peribacteria bacterium]|jgi:hypothetical protein|nr:hypothetical protein [Candidatus Peribacteria bacterium]